MRHADHLGGSATARNRGRLSAREHVLPAGRPPPRHPQGLLRFVAGGALILALAGVAVGASGYLAATRAQSRAETLGQTVSSLVQRLRADERHAAAAQTRVRAIAARAAGTARQAARVATQLADVSSQMQGFQAEVGRYSSCLPELQAEITGLVIRWHMGRFKSSPAYVTLADKAHVSRVCR